MSDIAKKPHAAAVSNNMTKSPPVDGHDADQDDLSGEDNSKDGSVDDTVDEPSTHWWWMWHNSPAATDGPQDDQRTDSNAKDDKDDNSKPKSVASPRDPHQDDRLLSEGECLGKADAIALCFIDKLLDITCMRTHNP